MSWSLYAFPLHAIAANDAWDWVTTAESSFGVPERPPPPANLPKVAAIVTAFREAGCHGTAWFRIDGLDLQNQLPECPGTAICRPDDGLDLGEVRLDPGAGQPLTLLLNTPIVAVTFRKPASLAVLTAVHRLVSSTEPMLVTDADGTVFVISPGDDLTELTRNWPW